MEANPDFQDPQNQERARFLGRRGLERLARESAQEAPQPSRLEAAIGFTATVDTLLTESDSFRQQTQFLLS